MQNEKDVKTKIRKEVKQRRAEASSQEIKEKSEKITQTFLTLLEYQEAETVYAYMDCKNEVQTRAIIQRAWDDKKKVAVPKVHGETMEFYYITSFEDLKEGYFGIQEPVVTDLASEEDALMILPGVAFDETCHRVGYGGGFYDRYLEKYPNLKKVALAFEFQVYTTVPFESFDQQPEKIITERRCILK